MSGACTFVKQISQVPGKILFCDKTGNYDVASKQPLPLTRMIYHPATTTLLDDQLSTKNIKLHRKSQSVVQGARLKLYSSFHHISIVWRSAKLHA